MPAKLAVQYLDTVHTFTVLNKMRKVVLILLCSCVWSKEVTGIWIKLYNKEHHDLDIPLAIYYYLLLGSMALSEPWPP